MGLFGFLSYTSESDTKESASESEGQHVSQQSATLVLPITDKSESASQQQSSAQSTVEDHNATAAATEATPQPLPPKKAVSFDIPEPATKPKPGRRLSFQSLAFIRKHPAEHKPTLSKVEDHEKRAHAADAAQKRIHQKESISKSDKRAKTSALAVRVLIVGPTSAGPKMTPAVAKPELKKIKSQLLEPKTANKLIAQLRRLPASDDATGNNGNSGPIHAVCLVHTDAEEETLHFAKLASPETAPSGDSGDTVDAAAIPGVVSAPLDELSKLFKEMRVIDLIKSPDLGLGQPGDGEGLLAGAVPTAETVIEGVRQITPQLMALGYATGRAIVPDHTGVYPPTDRMSVLTYWWGLELLLPPPSLEHLSSVQSVTGSVMNFLSALSIVNNGVREILPFIRYIAQFIDFEFSAIKQVDQGNGVVCAATWIMPAAMVPRAWDFPPPPPGQSPAVPSEEKGSDDRLKLPPGHSVVIPSGPLPLPMSAST